MVYATILKSKVRILKKNEFTTIVDSFFYHVASKQGIDMGVIIVVGRK